MPFNSQFKFPYLFRPNYRYNYIPQYVRKPSNNNHKPQENLNIPLNETKSEDSNNKQDNCSPESSECLFEIFGLKLYIDDVLIMCILYFLYTEGVQDQELFLCLILLLLS